MSERDVLQERLASILLKYLHGTTSASDIVAEAESVSKRIFLSSHPSEHYSPPPALLEALLMLSATNPSLSRQTLSCIVILSLCSVEAWIITANSTLFCKCAHVVDLLIHVATANNSCWYSWSQAEQEKASSACMLLSDFDMYVREGYHTTLTPVVVALHAFRPNFQSSISRDGNDLQLELRKFVHRIPPKIWASIPASDLPFALHAAVEAKVPEDRFLPHLTNSFVIRSPVVQESLYVLRQHGISLAEDIFLKLFKEHMDCSTQAPSQLLKNFLNGIDPINEREAFDLAKTSSDGESSKVLQDAARRWIELNRLNLVCAAYLAAPKLLNRIAGCSEGICKGIQRLSLSFYSPVDQTIDRALSAMLGCIPEIATNFLEESGRDQDAYSALQKAALMYPFITLRRTKCLCAAGQTVLTGLSDPSERYKPYCLRVIQTLLSVFSALPATSKPEVEDFCVTVFEFVLAEKRLKNGIPEFLSAISVSVMRLLCRYGLKGRTDKLLKSLNIVIEAEGSSENAMDAARDLRTYILCKQ